MKLTKIEWHENSLYEGIIFNCQEDHVSVALREITDANYGNEETGERIQKNIKDAANCIAALMIAAPYKFFFDYIHDETGHYVFVYITRELYFLFRGNSATYLNGEF